MTRERGRRCVDHLLNDLESLLERYRAEYDITYVELVGCLESIKSMYLREPWADEE